MTVSQHPQYLKPEIINTFPTVTYQKMSTGTKSPNQMMSTTTVKNYNF